MKNLNYISLYPIVLSIVFLCGKEISGQNVSDLPEFQNRDSLQTIIYNAIEENQDRIFLNVLFSAEDMVWYVENVFSDLDTNEFKVELTEILKWNTTSTSNKPWSIFRPEHDTSKVSSVIRNLVEEKKLPHNTEFRWSVIPVEVSKGIGLYELVLFQRYDYGFTFPSSDILSANYGFFMPSKEWSIDIRTHESACKMLKDFTSEHIDRYIAIADDEVFYFYDQILYEYPGCSFLITYKK